MIKKSIIALAVASSALTGIAQADGTTLYGSVRVAYDYVSFENVDFSNVVNKGSRLGVKGSNDLGDGLSAGYKIELGADGNSREYYVNLNGSFGTLQAGRFTLPYNDIVTYSDLFNGASGAYLGRESIHNLLFEGGGLKFDTLAYISPDLSGFKFTAGIVADMKGVLEQTRLPGMNEEHIDAYQLTAAYENSGFYAGLGWLREVSSKGNIIGGSLGYENDTFKVGLSAENYDSFATFYALAGSFNFNEANKIYASYGTLRPDHDDLDSNDSYGIGYQHNLSDNTRLWVEYGAIEVGDDDDSIVSIGLRTDF